MLKTFAAIAALSSAFLFGPARADTTQLVRDGFSICAQHAAQVRKAKGELEAIGWISQGIENDLRLFLTRERDGIGAINSASFDQNACAFGVKGMKVPTSVQLGESIARQLFGKTVQVVPKGEIGDPAIKAAWIGKVGKFEAGLAVYKEVNYPNFYRGSALMLVFKQ